MFLGKVIGTVVAEKKYQGLQGVKLLVVQPLNRNRKPVGDPIVSVDTQQAGTGDTVFMEDGREASYTLPVRFVPVEAAVVGIVDMVDVEPGA
jgi:ethanolamine utilization protein EutN